MTSSLNRSVDYRDDNQLIGKPEARELSFRLSS
jgi:hypothetical protein